MNTLKSYIKEGLFKPDSIEDQVDNQYLASLTKILQQKLKKSIGLKNRNTDYNGLLSVIDYELIINTDIVDHISINEDFFKIIDKYFGEYNKISFSQPNMREIIINCPINKQRAKIINELFKDVYFKHINIYGEIDGLTINYGINAKDSVFTISTCSSFYFYSKIKNLNINIVKLDIIDKNYQIYSYTNDIEDIKNIKFTFADSSLKSKFKSIKKYLTITTSKSRNNTEIIELINYIKAYFKTKDDNIYKNINNKINEFIKNIDLYNYNTEIKFNTEVGSIIIYLKEKENKILMTYLKSSRNRLEIEFPY